MDGMYKLTFNYIQTHSTLSEICKNNQTCTKHIRNYQTHSKINKTRMKHTITFKHIQSYQKHSKTSRNNKQHLKCVKYIAKHEKHTKQTETFMFTQKHRKHTNHIGFATVVIWEFARSARSLLGMYSARKCQCENAV